MTTLIEENVRTEVEDLHRFFVGWFSGVLDESEFETGFLNRFDPDFLLIPPAGSLLTLSELTSSIRSDHGSNPDFRIAIRNVRVHRVFDGEIVATYEEWQRNAIASTPAENARIATVLFKKTEPLQWLHVHETWMPESVMTAGSYDF
ncbi:MAG: hypothetical protein ACI9ZT_000318 [Gammaproteobacteria bacterium]|jgi:hypothetical protein